MAEQKNWQTFHWRPLAAIAAAITAAFIATGGATSAPPVPPVHAAVAAWAQQHPGQPVPLIVQHTGDPDGLESFVRSSGGTVEREFHIIPALDVSLPSGRLAQLAARSDVNWVSLDAPVASAATNEPLPNPSKLKNTFPASVTATKVWSQYAGQGVGVAVIDTGISDNGNADFSNGTTSRVKAEIIATSASTSDQDGYGHGTHVAGLIGSDGSQKSDNRYAGVAPAVNLLEVKVAGDDGSATLGDVMAGLQWVDDNRSTYNIRAVNMSLSSSVAQSYLVDPLDAAVELLWFHNIAVVVSAGNLGSAADAVSYPPSNDPFVISVGAVDENGTTGQNDDTLTSWSSRGSTQDGVAKPDVVAPGRNLISDTDLQSVLAKTMPDHIVDGSYFRMSGTSMASGVVSGIVALIRQAHPDWTPGQVKYVLAQTARPISGDATSKEPLTDKAVAFTGNLLSSDDGLRPSNMLLAAAGVSDTDMGGMHWRDASFNGIRWAGLELNGIRWGTVDWSGIRWGSVSFDGIRWGGTSWDGIRWGGIRWGNVSE